MRACSQRCGTSDTLRSMSSVALFLIAFACLFGGAWIGMTVRRVLPEHHLSRDSTDVIKLATGLTATLVALVLSLLVSSANSFRGTVETIQAGARGHRPAQYLRAFGPEAQDIRRQLRRDVVHSFRLHWPDEDFEVTQAATNPGANPVIDLEDGILELNPTGPKQKWFQAQALQLANELVRLRQLMSGDQSRRTLPGPIVIVLLAAATAVFASFSLFVQPNPTVVLALAVAALAVSGALFLIVELNSPFSGLLQLPSDPAHAAYAALGE